LHNYQLGHKLFEVDLAFTEDNILATLHERNADPIKSFILESARIRPYTLLSFAELCELMLKYNDIYIITDTKNFQGLASVKRTFSYMANIIEKMDPKLNDRFVIQIYNQNMFHYLSQNYNFKNYIYTLYASHDSNKQVIEFVKKTKIPVVTLPRERVTPDFIKALNNVGVFSFVHTVNDLHDINELFKMGVFGVYTDFVTYNDMSLTRRERYPSLLYKDYKKNRIKN
jgi:glycerophosphoryl diester phosphodiesterase